MATSSNPARIMLWSTPRSVSTAFARSMTARGDTEMFWEPYLACYSFGPDREIHWGDDLPNMLNDKYTYSYIKELLNADYPGAKVLFVKGMVEGIRGHFDVVERTYKHSFLIRHPKKSFRSLARLESDLNPLTSDFNLRTFKEIYHDLERFYHHVETEFGQSAPTIIDADDLVTQPEKILPKYCEAMGIDFKPKMLNWESVNADQLNWHCTDVGDIANSSVKDSIVLSNALKGSGFGKAPDPTKESSSTALVKQCAEHALPAYERLYALRIRP
ncbi:branched-chain-amino-acid aminotransferase-like protein 2 [Strongylocentrotus purpuratus]|uniref:Sulfotransferase family protein n=1 Tax=Strongylocentrotus purpuratus TaxID=7668 RepID=A0A7M7GI75_STRPU|nr:branched-chain-amino-acid aminotransferase-like protein 2 [Strongylocentrotus purpuratus]|eukprot:XP_003731237.1 PREDICTED: branched-chain-amino-acid aminotransferase-like protein 2 [Strongylocentrotus purpuratus]